MSSYHGLSTVSLRRRAKNGSNGRGIANIIRWYYLSTSNTELKDGSWGMSVPTKTAGTWIWFKDITTYTDGEQWTTHPICMTGDAGDSGRGVKTITRYYYLSTSSTELQDGAWGTSVPTRVNGTWIWTKDITTFTDNSTSETSPINVSGFNGSDGKTSAENQNRGFYSDTAIYQWNDSIRDSFLYKKAEWPKYIRFRVKTKGASLQGVAPTSTAGDDNYEAANDLGFVAESVAFTEEQITDKLTVRKMKTAATGARIEAEGTLMKVFGTSNVANIIFGVNSDGLAVLTYYDNNGNKLYDLGPSGIAYVQVREAKMTQMYMRLVGTTADAVYNTFSLAYNGDALPKATKKLNTDTVYKFTAKMVAGIVDANQSAYDGKYYSSSSTNSATGAPSGSTIPDGWYEECDTDSTDYGNVENVDYDNSVLGASTLDNYDSRNEQVIAQPYVHSKVLFHYVSGVYTNESLIVYWNSTLINR